jgi:hypothetical protein
MKQQIELVNIYTVVSDKFLHFGRGNLNKSLLPTDEIFDFLDLEYPYELQDSHREVLTSISLDIPSLGITRITYFMDGVFSIEVNRFLDASFHGINELISASDIDREVISTWLRARDTIYLLSRICNAYGFVHLIEDKFHLTQTYSHNIFHTDLDMIVELYFPKDNWISSNSEFVADLRSTAAVNLVRCHNGEYNRALGAMRGFTVFFSAMDQACKICIKRSREIIEGDLSIIGDDSTATDLERKLGFLEQFIIEIRSVDFLSDPFEESIGNTLARSWDWHKVADRALTLTNHLRSQVDKVRNQLEIQANARMNQFLFSVTFLTILDVAANILNFHDIHEAIVPSIRALYIGAVVLFFVVVIRFYVAQRKRRIK